MFGFGCPDALAMLISLRSWLIGKVRCYAEQEDNDNLHSGESVTVVTPQEIPPPKYPADVRRSQPSRSMSA